MVCVKVEWVGIGAMLPARVGFMWSSEVENQWLGYPPWFCTRAQPSTCQQITVALHKGLATSLLAQGKNRDCSTKQYIASNKQGSTCLQRIEHTLHLIGPNLGRLQQQHG